MLNNKKYLFFFGAIILFVFSCTNSKPDLKRSLILPAVLDSLVHDTSNDDQYKIKEIRTKIVIEKDKNDTLTIDLLLAFFEKYALFNSDSSRLKLLDEVKTICEKKKYKKGVLEYYIRKAIYWDEFYKKDSCLATISKGIKYCKENNFNTIPKFDLIEGNLYLKYTQFDTAFSKLNIALTGAKQIRDSTTIQKSFMAIGFYYAYKVQYDSAISLFNQSLNYAIHQKDTINIYKLCISLTDTYQYLDQIDSSYKYVKIAEKIAEKLQNQAFIGDSHLAHSRLFMRQEKFQNAKAHLLAGLKGNYPFFAYNDLILLYTELNNIDSALYYAKQLSQNCPQQLKMNQLRKQFNIRIAEAWLQKPQVDSCKKYYFIADQIKDERKYPSISISLAKIFLEEKKYILAKEKALKGLQEALEQNEVYYYKYSYLLLSEIYTELRDFEESNKYLNKYISLNDSLNKFETIEKTEYLEAKNREEKTVLLKQQQEKQASQEIEIVNQHLQQQKQLRNFSIIFSILIIAILWIVYMRYKTRQKLLSENQRIQSAKEIAELDQKLLRTQMNPHFIFNILASIQNFIYKDKKEEAHVYVGKFAKLMRSILENSREEFVSMEKEIKTLEHYLSLNQLLLDNKFDFKIEIDEEIDITNTQIPPMLAQPFIENALKHGVQSKETPGVIKIIFKKVDAKNIQFEVEDNGIGLSKSIQTDHKSFATDITQERLNHLYNNKKVTITMNEITNSLNETIGTKTLFIIPYKIS